MVSYKHNQPYYEIYFSELKDENINVLSFEGKEKISELFEYQIRFISENSELDSSKILNKPAALVFNRGDEDPFKIHGIISNLEQYGKSNEYNFYKVTLVPTLWRLGLNYQNGVFENYKLEDLIELIFKKSDLDFKIDLKNSYPESEYLVQYKETDLNFINRRLEHFGIYYYFDHSNDKDMVVITDNNNSLPKIDIEEPIRFNLNNDPFGEVESIQEISCKERVVTGLVKLKDYNYMFPEKQLIGQSQINDNDPGFYYDYGDNFLNENEAEFLAKIRNQEFIAQSKIFYGISDCRLFRAGYRFDMDKHYRNDWNDEYVLTSINCKGQQKSLFAFLPEQKKYEPTFECNFEAIPFIIEYRPLRHTPTPKVTGIMSAKILSSAGDEYASVDDHGRYRAKMNFDLSDEGATMPLRLSQFYSGPGYGIHFPNHEETELLWSCVDGNPDRPVGLGTVPNPSTATPVSQKNRKQNIIRTASGNELIMDDSSKETKISLTSSGDHKISLNDADKKIEIISKQGHKLIMDDEEQKIEVTSKEGHKILMDDKNTKLEVVTKNGHFMKIDDTGGDEKIHFSDKPGKNFFTIDITNNKIVIETKDGDIDILAPKGDIKIKSKNLTIETEEDTKL
ncbi:MAG: type VI secretion system tip protein TssI/VgrG, partial [Ignavibacteriaceae bacterium]|nr:type VI secretion system tip protein TssI/VgrG [Ignavibacteriaceae bacterium]